MPVVVSSRVPHHTPYLSPCQPLSTGQLFAEEGEGLLVLPLPTIRLRLCESLLKALARSKSQRRTPISGGGYRTGYGKPRQLTLSCGTITVRRPRVRGGEARFVSPALPLFKRKRTAIEALVPELYLHGLAQADFDLALRRSWYQKAGGWV
jgi:hypothetical protein